VYDRSALINRAVDTLKRTLLEESAIVALVCMIFLLHARSALVAIITLPLGVLIAYICMWLLGLSSNIMSLGGIAIAIGAMVDAAIVMIENAHKRLEQAPPDKQRPHTRAHNAPKTSHATRCGSRRLSRSDLLSSSACSSSRSPSCRSSRSR